MRALLPFVASLALLASCVEQPSVTGREPLRTANTPEERLFLRCVAADPLFTTEECQRARAALSADPRPGVFGR